MIVQIQVVERKLETHAKLPPSFTLGVAELTEDGCVQLRRKTLTSSVETTHRGFRYRYDHKRKWLVVTLPNGVRASFDFELGSWWVSDAAGEFRSPWLIDWLWRLGVHAKIEEVVLPVGRNESRLMEIGPIRLILNGDVALGDTHYYSRGKRIEPTNFGNVSVRRVCCRTFFGIRRFWLLEALDHSTGNNVFYEYCENRYWQQDIISGCQRRRSAFSPAGWIS